ncbi:hypothetical protein GWK47_025373 [Chionoecetes opilio]|uniref:Uncharacterized protein n=1 Tax=Chionoecetes opilio TaxID=41210 RepID=A0A8J8WN35_CHIOP|nr:hypothetical protein GWK47_025373 [Chionoecetes opilio]
MVTFCCSALGHHSCVSTKADNTHYLSVTLFHHILYKMSEKREPPPTSAYGMSTPGVSYPQMMPQGAPPSYAESLSHPVVPGHPGIPPQFASPYMTQAAASAAHLQNYKVQISRHVIELSLAQWHRSVFLCGSNIPDFSAPLASAASEYDYDPMLTSGSETGAPGPWGDGFYG